MTPDSRREQRTLPTDYAPAVVAVLLVLGCIVLAVLERPIPAELSTSLGAAVSWLFVRSAQSAEHRQANRTADNGKKADPRHDFRAEW